MNEGNDELLKLSNQLCFPLYAASKAVIAKYTPVLDEIGLTYTQYITMMVLWEFGDVTVKTLGEKLYLDSGTLTPMLKKLETKRLVNRNRDMADERSVIVRLTETGRALKIRAAEVPLKIAGCFSLTQQDTKLLYGLLYQILQQTTQSP